MPKNKNAMTRYAIIDSMLSNRHRAVSIQDITDYINLKLPEFGLDGRISKRCVEKDIRYLEYDSPFCVELERYTVDAFNKNDQNYKKRCIRYADPTFSIFQKNLTDDQKSILSSALTTLGCFDGLDNFEWLNELREQFDIKNSTPVISISKNLVQNSKLISSLFTAVVNQQVLEISYNTFIDKQERKTIVSPYLIKEYNRRWYLICGAYDTNKILNFALDRIISFKELNGYAFRPCSSNLEERFEDIIGVTYNEDNPVQSITLWANEKIAGYIRTKPLHESQIHLKGDSKDMLIGQYTNLPNGEFFKIECRKNFELLKELMSWGDGLIVLSPKSLRDEIKDIISKMNHTYNLIE